jgi:hypothetical protein
MVAQALALIKAKLGISTTIRDIFLTAIINGILKELEDTHGIIIDEENASHLMFVVDYSEYRYSNKDNPIMPRHLQFRLHNLLIHSGGDAVV